MRGSVKGPSPLYFCFQVLFSLCLTPCYSLSVSPSPPVLHRPGVHVSRLCWFQLLCVSPGVCLPHVLSLPLAASATSPSASGVPCPPSPTAVISIQREPISAVSSDITFPMRGRRGMKDWVRHSEDRLFLPKEVLSLSAPGKPATPGAATAGSPGRGRGPGTVPPGPGPAHQRLLPADPDESSYFVIGAVLYRTLGLILPPPR